MANNKLNRIKEGYKLLSLLEHKELKDVRMYDEYAILYFVNGDTFVLKGYRDESMANKDFKFVIDEFEKERKEKNGVNRKDHENWS